jgi:hypothetical protein
MSFGAEYMLNNVRCLCFSVVDAYLVEVKTIILAIIPGTHDMPVASVV